jgi:hypothetical protein
MKACGGSGWIDPRFLDFGTIWRWVVSFTPRLLYPREKNPRYPLDRRLGGPQSRSGQFIEVKNLDPTGTRTPTRRSSSPYPVAIPTTLTRLMISNMLVEKKSIEGGVIWPQQTAPWRYRALRGMSDSRHCSYTKKRDHVSKQCLFFSSFPLLLV